MEAEGVWGALGDRCKSWCTASVIIKSVEILLLIKDTTGNNNNKNNNSERIVITVVGD